MAEYLAEHYYGIDVLATSATLSMTNTVAAYPATNGNNRRPDHPMKASTTATVITMTGLGGIDLDAFAIVNHNLVGATVTLANGSGLSQVIAIPARSADGQSINAWKDLRDFSLAQRTAASWTLTITGAAAPVAIGELVATSTFEPLPLLLGVELGKKHLQIVHKTFYGVKLQYDRMVRTRRLSGSLMHDDDRTPLLALWDAVRGPVWPWLLIPDVDVNDAWYVQFVDEEIRWTRDLPNAGDLKVVIEELSSGLTL